MIKIDLQVPYSQQTKSIKPRDYRRPYQEPADSPNTQHGAHKQEVIAIHNL